MNRNIWPSAIGLFYGCFAVAVVGVAIFAMRQPSDLVAEDYYARELKHQARIDSETRGLASTEFAVNVAPDARALDLRLPGQGITGEINLYRPSSAALDRTIPLAPGVDGHQRIDLSGSAAGLWKVQVRWVEAGVERYREDTVVLP